MRYPPRSYPERFAKQVHLCIRDSMCDPEETKYDGNEVDRLKSLRYRTLEMAEHDLHRIPLQYHLATLYKHKIPFLPGCASG